MEEQIIQRNNRDIFHDGKNEYVGSFTNPVKRLISRLFQMNWTSNPIHLIEVSKGKKIELLYKK